MTWQPSLFDKNTLVSTPSFFTAVNYLEDTLKHGIKPGFERISALLELLGNPHKEYETILITGTNGKTSTARMISSILSSMGLKAGLYTSPHLHSYCERIEFNGEKISEEDFVDTLQELKPLIKKVDDELNDPLTNFEIITALAFHYFAKKKTKCLVAEVGMGARFDATCLTDAKVSVITNVELDHTDYLGSSIEKIAKEKAFVIKSKTKVITGLLKPDAQRVIESRANEQQASIYTLDRDFSLRSLKSMPNHALRIDVQGMHGHYDYLKLSVVGKHQASNACLAIAAAEAYLQKMLYVVKFKKPLSKLVFYGRLEIMQVYPTVVVDGAHNPAGARNLAQVLKNEFKYNRLIIVLAVFKDKDYQGIIDELAPLANELIFSENSSQRCIKASELASSAIENSKVIKSLAKAINEAKKMASSQDLICITGSLTTVADARTILRTKELDGS